MREIERLFPFLDNSVDKPQQTVIQSKLAVFKKTYRLAFTFKGDYKYVGRAFPVRSKRMAFVGFMKEHFSLGKRYFHAVRRAKNALLVRVNELPKIVRFLVVVKGVRAFEIVNDDDTVNHQQVFNFVLVILLVHNNIIPRKRVYVNYFTGNNLAEYFTLFADLVTL